MARHKKIDFHEVANWDGPNRFVFLTRKMVYFCIKSPNKIYIGITLFIVLSILIGTLTICITSIKPKYKCRHVHQRTVTDIKNFNSRPHSVAIDYINDDKLLDFVIVNTGLNSVDIYLGQNNQTFEHHKTYSTGSNSYPLSVAVGNFDNQSGIDIAIANFGTNNILILMGFNDGSFIFHQSFSTGSSRPIYIAVDDLNNDHRLDIVVLNYGTNSIGIYIASKDGFFVLSMIYPTGYDSLPNSLTIADLNNDNQLDIVVVNFGTNNIGLFFGYGNGTFDDQKIYSTDFQSNPSSVAVGDINNDHYFDIIVANSGTKNIKIFFGNIEGNFLRQTVYSINFNSHPQFVALHDYNNDNRLDIIAIDSINGRIYFLPGNENGTFPLLTMYMTDFGSTPISLDVADFDHDNRSDVLIVNRDANNVLMLMKYYIKISAIYTTFTAETIVQPISIATGDLNGDHLLDLIVTNANDSRISVFLGYGDGSFMLFGMMSTGIGVGIEGVVLDDFNNDQKLDIAVLNPANNSLSILLGYGNGTFSSVTTYSTEPLPIPSIPTVSDVNNDNCLDIIIIGYTSEYIGVCTGYCNGTFELTSIYNVGTNSMPYRIAIDDFNNDNHVDLVISYSTQAFIGILFGDDNGRFSAPPIYLRTPAIVWWAIASGDFNNDNRSDVVGSSARDEAIGIWFGYGNGSFATMKYYTVKSCSAASSIVVADFNSDRQLDIALSCSSSKNIVILFGLNNGAYWLQTTYSTGDNSYPFSLVSGDFNNDNKLDMAVVDWLGHKVGILMTYYKATFAIERKYSTGSSPQPYSVATADFNNDHLSDLVVVNSGTKNIGIRLGFGNGSFGIETVYSTGSDSFPDYVNVHDLNGDEQVDVVIADSKGDSIIIFLGNGDGTFGSTLTYSMDRQSNPTWVAIANLNNDQWSDLVITNQGTDNIGILYGYNYATFTLHRTYLTDQSSPRSILVVDINNDNRLDIVVGNAGSSNIQIFFGDGDGNFSNEITYPTEHGSYPTAVAAADLNKDGHLDIIIGNAITGSIDILLSDGNGNFGNLIIHPTDTNSFPQTIIIADVNNDDQLDLVMSDSGRHSVSIFLGFGNGSLSLVTTCLTGSDSGPDSIALGDLNNDSYLDIVVDYLPIHGVGVLQGYGNGSFACQMPYLLGNDSYFPSIALGHFNSDDQLDIAISNAASGYVEIFLRFGNGRFSNSKKYFIGFQYLPSGIVVDYFNDDDRADIAVVCDANIFIVLFGTEDGDFLIGRQYAIPSSATYNLIASADLNNDSRIDLVISNWLDDKIYIFLGNRSEPFGTPNTITTGFGSQPHSAVTGDFNHDNRSDIVVSNYGTNNIAIILASEIDSFTDLITYPMPIGSRPYVVTVGDFNDDNQLDIAVVNSGTNDVTIFQGHGNGLFAAMQSYSTGVDSIPRSIAVADFNNDQKLDLAIANAGANDVIILFGFANGTFGNETSYSMRYNSRPYSVAVGDFDNDGWMDMVVANSGADYVEILLQPC